MQKGFSRRRTCPCHCGVVLFIVLVHVSRLGRIRVVGNPEAVCVCVCVCGSARLTGRVRHMPLIKSKVK